MATLNDALAAAGREPHYSCLDSQGGSLAARPLLGHAPRRFSDVRPEHKRQVLRMLIDLYYRDKLRGEGGFHRLVESRRALRRYITGDFR